MSEISVIFRFNIYFHEGCLCSWNETYGQRISELLMEV